METQTLEREYYVLNKGISEKKGSDFSKEKELKDVQQKNIFIEVKSQYFLPSEYFEKAKSINYKETIDLNMLVDNIDVMPTPLEELTIEEIKNLSKEQREYYKQELWDRLKDSEKKREQEYQQKMKKAGKISFMGIADTICMNLNPFQFVDAFVNRTKKEEKSYEEMVAEEMAEFMPRSSNYRTD